MKSTMTVYMFDLANPAEIVVRPFASEEMGRVFIAQRYPGAEVKKVRTLEADLVPLADIHPGDRVFAMDALFDIGSVHHLVEIGDQKVTAATSTWVCGDSVPNYYGPGKGWTFQGVEGVSHYRIRK